MTVGGSRERLGLVTACTPEQSLGSVLAPALNRGESVGPERG